MKRIAFIVSTIVFLVLLVAVIIAKSIYEDTKSPLALEYTTWLCIAGIISSVLYVVTAEIYKYSK